MHWQKVGGARSQCRSPDIPELRPAVVTDMDLATLPGVMFGSSSILFRELPCHGCPGTNSGMSKLFCEEVLGLGAPEDWVIGRWFGDWLALPVEWDSFWLSRNWVAVLPVPMFAQAAPLEELAVDQGLFSAATPPVHDKHGEYETRYYWQRGHIHYTIATFIMLIQ